MTAKGKGQKAKGKSIRSLLLPIASYLLLFSFFLFPFSFSLVACGKKGDPRPPELAVPETIKDLKAAVGGKGIVLTWSRPMRMVDGGSMRDLAGFIIFRQEIPKTSPCPECPVPYRERVAVNVEDQEKFVKKKKFMLIDQELKPETTYRYRIVSQLVDGTLSDRSNEVEVAWRP